MLLFDARPGSLTYKAGELAKRIVFRSKWLNFRGVNSIYNASHSVVSPKL
jgi:hypothetical protein